MDNNGFDPEGKLKDLAKGIGQQIEYTALQQIAVEDGYVLAEKVQDDKPFKYEQVVQEAIKSGQLFELKVAVAAAIKVGAEQNKFKNIPAGTSAAACADLAHIGTESTKTLNDVAEGRCTPREGMERMADVAAATVTRSWTKKGMEIGAGIGAKVGGKIGSIFGPAGKVVGTTVGAVMGGFVGATVGKLASTAVGQAVVAAAKKVVTVAKETVKKVATAVKEGVKSMGKKIGRFFKKLFS